MGVTVNRALLYLLITLFIIPQSYSAYAKDISSGKLSNTLNAALDEINAGNAQSAYDSLIQLEVEHAGNSQFDYVLGLSALESGNAGYAVFALLRAISMDSRNIGAVLDLGRAYYHLGEYSESEKSLKEVLTYNPADNVKTVASYYLTSIYDKRAKSRVSPLIKRISVGLMGGYDSNANSSPAIDTFLEIPLNEKSQALGSTFMSADLSLVSLYRLNKGHSLNAKLKFASKKFKDADFVNSDIFTGSIGAEKRTPKTMFSINASAMQSYIAGNKSGGSLRLMGLSQYSLLKQTKVSVFSQWALIRNAEESKSRDVNQLNIGLGLLQTSEKRGNWQANITATYGQATAIQKLSSYGNKNYGLISSVVKRLNKKYNAKSIVSAALINTRYNGEFSTDAGVQLRRDWLASATWNNQMMISKTWQLGVSVLYTVSRSNVSLYDYRRTMTSLSVRRGF